MQKKRITEEKAREFYAHFKTPAHVIGHCQGVARTACRLAEALNKKGASFDVPLVYGSAIIHDMARTFENHQGVAADFLRNAGYYDEAVIVSQHMTYSFASTKAKDLTELDLVCLGDRLVRDDKYVGLDARMQYIIDKAKRSNPASKAAEIERRILEKKKFTRALMDNIEKVIGQSIDSLMEE